MMLDDIIMKECMPDLRERVIDSINKPLSDILELHLEYENAYTKLMTHFN